MPSAKDKTIATLCLIARPGEFYIPLTNNIGIYNSIGFNVGECAFSRNSIATLAGKIYGVNEPRQDIAKGTLISPQATNLFTPDSMWLNQTDGKWVAEKFLTTNIDLAYDITSLSGSPVGDRDQKYCYRVSLPLGSAGEVRFVTFVYKRNNHLRYFETGSALSVSLTVSNGLPDPLNRQRLNSEWIDYEITEDNFVVVRIKVTIGAGSVTTCRAYFESEAVTPEIYQMGIVQVSTVLSEYIPTASTEETQGADNLSVTSNLLGSGDFTVFDTVTIRGYFTNNYSYATDGSSNLESYFDGTNINIKVGTATIQQAITMNDGEQFKYVVLKSASIVRLVTSQGHDVSVAYLGDLVLTGTLHIGSDNAGANQLNSFVKNINPWQRLASEQEIQNYVNS